MRIIVKNVNIVQGPQTVFQVNVTTEDGVIRDIKPILTDKENAVVLDGEGMWLLPAFADMHYRFRDPGYTHRDDLLPGAKRAAAGGYTDICCMPDTSPPIDSVALVHDLLHVSHDAVANIHPIATVTHEMKGKRLTHFGRLRNAGAIAFSDNGRPIASMELMIEAMESAQENGSIIMVHEKTSRDPAPGGMYGSILSRDLYIAENNGGGLHLCEVANAEAIEMIAQAKTKCGGRVTCDASPREFSAVHGPAAATDIVADAARNAVIRGLVDGTIDAVSVDHAPRASSGYAATAEQIDYLAGLESAFCDVVTYLYQPGLIQVPRIAELMSTNPRRILGLPGGTVTEGTPADLVLCDLDTPFKHDGLEMFGTVVATIRNGNVTYANNLGGAR